MWLLYGFLPLMESWLSQCEDTQGEVHIMRNLDLLPVISINLTGSRETPPKIHTTSKTLAPVANNLTPPSSDPEPPSQTSLKFLNPNKTCDIINIFLKPVYKANF